MLQETWKRKEKNLWTAHNDYREHSTFTPLVPSTTGGLGKEAASFYKWLQYLLSTKWDTPYSMTITPDYLLAACVAIYPFSLLRSSIQAIRGARSNCRGHAAKTPISLDLVTTESRMFNLFFYTIILFLSFSLNFCCAPAFIPIICPCYCVPLFILHFC